MRAPLSRNAGVITAVAAAAIAGIVFAAVNIASSQEGTGVVDFARLTPIPFLGYPETVQPSLNIDEVPTCQAPEGERPDPNLPPLSCRFSGSEPPPGAIDTPAPDEVPVASDLASATPDEWRVIDNRAFRFTLAIPPDWYSNMRPDGGEFRVYDPVHTTKTAAKGLSGLRGGIAGAFSARALVTERVAGRLPDSEEHLLSPNASFNGYPAAVWEEPAGHGAAAIIRAAYTSGRVIYEIKFDVLDRERDPGAIAADIATVRQILTTIAPY